MTKARDIADSTTTLDVDGGTIKLDGNYPVGLQNVALGDAALSNASTGNNNTAIGTQSLLSNTGANNTGLGTNTLYYNTGSQNTALGSSALLFNTTASNNTAVGHQAGYSITTGTRNVVMGALALDAATTGDDLVAVGYGALGSNTTAHDNTAVGMDSLTANTTGSNNTAIGKAALPANTTASNNTAVGYQAGYSNTTGNNLSALGFRAGYSMTTGGENTFVGRESGYGTTTGYRNTYLGYYSGRNASTGYQNTFVGDTCGEDMSSGSKNTILGRFSGNQSGLDIRTSSNRIVLSDGDGNGRAYYDGTRWNMTSDTGNWPSVGSGTLRITGQSALTLNNRSNASTPRNQVEFYDLDDHLNGSITSTGTSNTTAYNTSSDRRLKTNFADFDAMALVSQMNPVQYNRIGDIDAGVDRLEYGFIAQELHTVLPQAVQEGGDDPQQDPWQLDYAKLTGVLTKAIQEQQATITALTDRITALEGA